MTSTILNSSIKLFEFMNLVGRLKRVKRTGWVLRNVQSPESVAEHMYRMAVLSFLVETKYGINKERCIKIALVHDIAECIVGDITPADGLSKAEKRQKEEAAMKEITALVNKDIGDEIYSLWLEYEEQSSEEAKFVKDLDKFEMILQAHEYEKSDGRPNGLQEFFDSTEGKFQTPQVKEWAAELVQMRRKENDT